MAFKSVRAPKRYISKKEHLEAIGKGNEVTRGYYRGVIDGKYGDQYIVEQDDGKECILASWGALTNGIENVSEGDYVLVIYLGSKLLESGKFAGKMFHDFDVQVDPERREGVPQNTFSSSEDAMDIMDEEGFEGDYEDTL